MIEEIGSRECYECANQRVIVSPIGRMLEESGSVAVVVVGRKVGGSVFIFFSF